MQSVPLILFLFALLGGAVAAIFAPLYLDLFRRELSRADEMEETARTLGLRFSRGDPAYPGSTAFRYPLSVRALLARNRASLREFHHRNDRRRRCGRLRFSVPAAARL